MLGIYKKIREKLSGFLK